MTTFVGIRTNRWGEDERRLFARLSPVFGDAVRIVYNGIPPEDLPAKAVALTDAWVDGAGLRRTPDWGWRCGDYAYYALREAEPEGDFYWLIEPDVHFGADPAPFFAAYGDAPEDALGHGYGPPPPKMRFARGMAEPHMWALFSLTRFSGRALDVLRAARVAAAASDVHEWVYPNDEIHSFSTVSTHADMSAGPIEAYASDWFATGSVSHNPDLFVGAIAEGTRGVFHPVRDRASFRGAITERIEARLGFLKKTRASFAALDDADLDSIALTAAADLRIKLAALAGRPPPHWAAGPTPHTAHPADEETT